MRWSQRLIRRARTEKQLDSELQFHLDKQFADYVATGMTQEEARRRARLEFGGLDQVKEECRDVGAARFVETLIQDVRYGFRQLRRNPGFAALAIMTLAIGIAATTAIFSVMNGVLLEPLPYPHPTRLFEVSLNLPGIGLNNAGLTPAEYFIFHDQNHTFLDFGLYSYDSVNVTGFGQPERVPALDVTKGLLPILGVSPLLGRGFTRTDDKVGSPDTLMLTYAYWRSKFGGSRSVIGRTVDVSGKPHTIIGVLPKRFRFLDENTEGVLLPIKLDRAKTYLGDWDYMGIARLEPGVTLAEATGDVARMIPIVLRSFPTPPGYSLEDFKQLRPSPNVWSLKRAVVGDVGKVLWVLMGGIGLVLLIACANVANLLLVRVEGRRQELAIRSALGASPRRIAVGLLLESLVLSLIGGALGLAFAYGGLKILVATAPIALPRLNEIGISGPTLLFSLALATVAGLLFGSIPILKYACVRVGTGLREAERSLSASRERHRARNALTVVQVGLALVSLISSGLMIRTFRALTRVQPGFSAPAQVQTFRLFIPVAKAKTPQRVAGIEHAILGKIQALPGVSSVGIGWSVPMYRNRWTDPIFVKDRTPQGQVAPARRLFAVSPGFFKTLGTPFVAGRDITWSDITNEHPVAIISENMARDYWHNPADALGKQIRESSKADWRRIVGVVGDVYYDGTHQKAPAMVYFPLLIGKFEGQATKVIRNPAFAIRSPLAGSRSLMKEIRRAVWSVDPNLPLADVYTLNYYYTNSMAGTSFTLVMLALAGVMALLLALVGLYGVIAYSISQRVHEIGIRMALGAQKRDLLRLVLTEAARLTTIGLGIGILAAAALTRFMLGLLFGVKPIDPLTFVAVSLLLITVALLACYVPARRATKVDPMVALRHE
jgi:predicted permease